ncbi:hypothetical protein [Yinghuangia sp. YIM S10712]|uniref:hypothetical protein n=1 Tax=Yinghuangia sp. YIM S10712 TaxID=3436930 RepID=UPI003F533E6F
MPAFTITDQMLLSISTSKQAVLAAFPASGAKHPFPLADLIRQATTDRLLLAGEHLRAGDQLLFAAHYRSAISRYYYAMYQAARAVVFAEIKGDDHERHNILPRNLPQHLTDVAMREAELTDARLLRNQADYDVYPIGEPSWESDARGLAVTAANFVQSCETFASSNGHV